MFVSLAIWMLNKLGKNLKQPQEYDDPNLTINSILESCAQLVCYAKNNFVFKTQIIFFF